jgi:hypothetical protein
MVHCANNYKEWTHGGTKRRKPRKLEVVMKHLDGTQLLNFLCETVPSPRKVHVLILSDYWVWRRCVPDRICPSMLINKRNVSLRYILLSLH